MAPSLYERVLGYIRRRQLLRAGERLGVAVSGGADSVALLRLLLDLRDQFGLVLSVVHFNHKIRGADADDDEQFVRALAENCALPLHAGSGDVPAHAQAAGLSLETAARELRYQHFRALCKSGAVSGIATAHTLDDQAETVLLRLLRGGWTRGLAGIYPELPVTSGEVRVSHPVAQKAGATGVGPPEDGATPVAGILARSGLPVASFELPSPDAHEATSESSVVRPLLEIRRTDLQGYLRALGQDWREDASNRDLKHMRNRVRHLLLPLLEREFNPGIAEVLAETAEIARAEEAYWRGEVDQALAGVAHRGAGEAAIHPIHLRLNRLSQFPLALQRRIIRQVVKPVALDFGHVEQVLQMKQAWNGAELELPGSWRVGRLPRCPEELEAGAELIFEFGPPSLPRDYEYLLQIPGEVWLRETKTIMRATVIPVALAEQPGYDPRNLLDAGALAPAVPPGSPVELQIRNWRPGDRFWPTHSKSAKKVKELLQTRKVFGPERALWPVAVNPAGELVWVRGFGVMAQLTVGPRTERAILIEESRPGATS